jgi:hypothetical protein
MRTDENPCDFCYVCTLPVLEGQPRYVLKDEDGLLFLAHQACVENDMVRVPDED